MGKEYDMRENDGRTCEPKLPTNEFDSTWYQRPLGIPEHNSAGGVIVRLKDEQVFIALVTDTLYPGYGFPKGEVEKGETLEKAAYREILEEAGFSDLKLICKLGIRARLNFAQTKWKVTHYFLFVTDEMNTSPIENKRHSVAWFPMSDLPNFAWPEQRELLDTNWRKIHDLVKKTAYHG